MTKRFNDGYLQALTDTSVSVASFEKYAYFRQGYDKAAQEAGLSKTSMFGAHEAGAGGAPGGPMAGGGMMPPGPGPMPAGAGAMMPTGVPPGAGAMPPSAPGAPGDEMDQMSDEELMQLVASLSPEDQQALMTALQEAQGMGGPPAPEQAGPPGAPPGPPEQAGPPSGPPSGPPFGEKKDKKPDEDKGNE